MKILFVLILLYLLPVAAGTSDACQFLKVDLSKLEKEYQHYSAAVTMLKEVRSSYLPDDSQFVGFTPGGQVVYILSKSRWTFKTIYDNETYTGLEKICTEMGGLPNKFGANDLYHVFNFTATYGYENEGQVLAVRSFREGHVVWMDGSTCFLQTSMNSWIDTPQKRDDLRFIGYRLSWDGVIIKETPIRLVPPPYTIIDMPLLCMIPNKITVKMAKLHRRIARSMDYKFHEYNSTLQSFSKLLDSVRAHHLITSDIADSCPDLDLVNLQWPSLLTSSPTWPYNKGVHVQSALLDKWEVLNKSLEALPSVLRTAKKLIALGTLVPDRNKIFSYLFTHSYLQNLRNGGIYEIFWMTVLATGLLGILGCIFCLAKLFCRPCNYSSLICSKCRKPPNPCSLCLTCCRKGRGSFPEPDSEDDMAGQLDPVDYGLPLGRLNPRVRSNNVFLRPRPVQMGQQEAPIFHRQALATALPAMASSAALVPNHYLGSQAARRPFAVRLLSTPES